LPAQVLARGGTGALRDLAIFLSDDHRSVLIFCDYTTSDDPPFSVLKLDGAISEEQFDAEGIAKFLHQDTAIN
jgi:hypothetical protein